MIKIEEIKLNEILPPLLKEDNTIAAIARVLQKYIEQNYNYIKRLNILTDIDNITNEDLIDHLAYQLHVDFYDPSLSLEKKRNLVKISIPQHRKKGTAGAIENLLTSTFGYGEVEEWYEYDGEPYLFNVFTDITSLNNGVKNFLKALNTAKNTRSHLEHFAGVVSGLVKIISRTVTGGFKFPLCNTICAGTWPYHQNLGRIKESTINIFPHLEGVNQRYPEVALIAASENLHEEYNFAFQKSLLLDLIYQLTGKGIEIDLIKTNEIKSGEYPYIIKKGKLFSEIIKLKEEISAERIHYPETAMVVSAEELKVLYEFAYQKAIDGALKINKKLEGKKLDYKHPDEIVSGEFPELAEIIKRFNSKANTEDIATVEKFEYPLCNNTYPGGAQ